MYVPSFDGTIHLRGLDIVDTCLYNNYNRNYI